MEEVKINWEIFVKLHSDEYMGVVIHTRLYNLIAANFPIEFILKLISIAYYSKGSQKLISVAVMVQDVAENRHFLEQVRRGITIGTTAKLRHGALTFMLHTAGLTQVVQSGQALAAVLLRWELESGGDWDAFVLLLKRVFFFSDSGHLYILLGVLCALPTELVTGFVSYYLEPSILEVYALFPERMIQLLERGDDHRPYFVLANVCGLFNAPQWSIMMEAAVMSSFFKNVYSPSRRVSVASSLRICFDHDADFNFSIQMNYKMRGIMKCLRYSREPSEKRAAMELYEAYCRRLKRQVCKERSPYVG